MAVDAEQVPPSVGAGAIVDVYLVPPRAGSAARPATDARSSKRVTVVDASTADDGFGATGKRQLVLGVVGDDAGAFFKALGGSDGATVTIVRRG